MNPSDGNTKTPAGRYQADPAEVIAAFQEGRIPEPEFRRIRAEWGVYQERDRRHFVRVRRPAGTMTPPDLRALAAIARGYGSGRVHITTRQDVQIHGLAVEALPAVLTALRSAGLSSRAACGDTVRNITTCPLAGVCPHERFDVTPWARAVHADLAETERATGLPRKLKIAFSGCRRDCAGAAAHDVGFVAEGEPRRPGFCVFVGGGLGATSRWADRLEEFIDARATGRVVRAVRNVFAEHGNRTERSKARLRFLVESLGFDQFRRLYRRELAGTAPPPIAVPLRPPAGPPRTPLATFPAVPRPEFDRWRNRNVKPQKQPGRYVVEVPLFLGQVEADALAGLADIADELAEAEVRATIRQNLTLRHVREPQLVRLHARLAELGLLDPRADLCRNLIVCVGAPACRLGRCPIRHLARRFADRLAEEGLDLGEHAVHLSGCPNACSRHPTAAIGAYGRPKLEGGELRVRYVIRAGGGETPPVTATEALRRLVELVRKLSDRTPTTPSPTVSVSR